MRFGSVYKIVNKQNGKAYIGQTTSTLSQRWYQHKLDAKFESRGFILAKAIRKYGTESFTVEEIASARSQEDLDFLEQHFIAEAGSLVPSGYNLKDGGKGGKHLPETIEKIRHSSANRSPETRRLYSIRSKERWNDPAHRQLVSEKQRALWTPERKAHFAKIAINTFKGKGYWKRASELKKIPLKVISSDGTIRTYESLTSAATNLNLELSAVSSCLSGKRLTHKGFTFARSS